MNAILIEFLEVLINQVLYLRGIYPSQIFKKKKAYNLPVFASLYPPLNTYIKNVLSEALTLLNNHKLQKLELRISKNDEILETFVFDINPSFSSATNENQLEDDFRSCIHSLDNRCKSLKKSSKDSKFKIFLHTDSFNFADETRNADFLWIKDESEPTVESTGVIPITLSSNSNSFHFYLERFT